MNTNSLLLEVLFGVHNHQTEMSDDCVHQMKLEETDF